MLRGLRRVSPLRLSLTIQGQCKPNAESLLYAEVQPVLALFEGKGTNFSALQQIIMPKRHGKRHASSNRSESLVQMADGRWQFSDGGGARRMPKIFIIYNIYII